MTKQLFRIVDLRDDSEVTSSGATPEAAGTSALGLDVVKSGSRKDLIGKAYWKLLDQPVNMVRLYRRIGKSPVAVKALLQ